MKTAAEGRPVIAGLFPDPTICRVGDRFYMAHSSFEYVPGAPLWESNDLVTWRQIGNVLERPSQLTPVPMHKWLTGGSASTTGAPVGRSGPGTGVYAPTLRHHGGFFYLTTTVVNEFERGPIIVRAASAAGPWSDPVHVEGLVGIDSDLAWDDDGTCWMALSSYASGTPSIVAAQIDPDKGRLLGEPIPLWSGTGGVAPESPHLYRRNGWWYLLLAEGGTGAGHAISMARARELSGEWEACPHNPILTHRGLSHPVQYAGHGDLVETSEGAWAMVFLGVRLRGVPGFHVNGRETFLAGIDWEDDWPRVVEDRYPVPDTDHAFEDKFHLPLGPGWVSPGCAPGDLLTAGKDITWLSARDDLSMLAVRTRDEHWAVELELDVSAGDGALHLRLDDSTYFEVRTSSGCIVSELRASGVQQITRGPQLQGSTVILRLQSTAAKGPVVKRGPDMIEGSILQDGVPVEVATIDGRFLSTEVAGGFTGRVIGPRAESGQVGLIRMSYRPLST